MRRILRRSLSLLLCFSLLFFLLVPSISAFAEGEVLDGMITGTTINVRSAPTTSTDNILRWKGQKVQLNSGHRLRVVDKLLPSQGGGSLMWYQVSFSYDGADFEGYICSDWVYVERPIAPDADFETQIERFPEDYKTKLRALHALHPSWIFQPLITGLDWNEVQENENVLGKSLTDSRKTSHRSTASGAYDWMTDTFLPQEGKNWFQASPELVAYYMDPRNFLNEVDIFQFEKLSYQPSVQTYEAVQNMLKGTFMENAEIRNFDGVSVPYAQAFLDAAARSQVSAFHLVARCIQESGRAGTSTGACGTVEGYEGIYNFFNVGANTGAMAGLHYAKYKTDSALFLPWDSQYKSIAGGAAFLSSGYITCGQDSLYFQKYCVTGTKGLYQHQYMTNVAAACNEGHTMQKNYKEKDLLDLTFVFTIPVYENMPSSPCPEPQGTGSPNNFLASLSVEGFSLTPGFDGFSDSRNYDLVINGNINTIKIHAAAVSSSATISGVGEVSLTPGKNIFTVTCISASGNARKYTVTVYVNGSSEEPPSVPSGCRTDYILDYPPYVSNIAPGTSLEAFLANLGLYGNASAYVTDTAGAVVGSGNVGSGQTLQLYDGTRTNSYQIVIFGDINGDGAVNAIDLLALNKTILGFYHPSEAGRRACDVDHNGAVNAIDLLRLNRAILGQVEIVQ